jgi:hypothetical protein
MEIASPGLYLRRVHGCMSGLGCLFEDAARHVVRFNEADNGFYVHIGFSCQEGGRTSVWLTPSNLLRRAASWPAILRLQIVGPVPVLPMFHFYGYLRLLAQDRNPCFCHSFSLLLHLLDLFFMRA